MDDNHTAVPALTALARRPAWRSTGWPCSARCSALPWRARSSPCSCEPVTATTAAAAG